MSGAADDDTKIVRTIGALAESEMAYRQNCRHTCDLEMKYEPQGNACFDLAVAYTPLRYESATLILVSRSCESSFSY